MRVVARGERRVWEAAWGGRSSSRSLYALVAAAATAARGMLLHRGLSSVIALDAKQLASALICLN